jgi:hypothetical protein
VTVASASVTNVNFTRVMSAHTLSGGIYVAGRSYDPATDGELWVSAGTQSVLATRGWWQMNVPDGSLVTLTATPTNPAYRVSADFPQPYRVVDDVQTLTFFVEIPGAMHQAGFASSGTNSDDTVGTVSIPVVRTLPPGWTNWPAKLDYTYWVDDSSTAEYGVDYKMNGGPIAFHGGSAWTASPYLIPLTVIHDGNPKSKTVVIRLAPASSLGTLGPASTFTYTITNPDLPAGMTRIAGMSISNTTLSLVITNLTATALHHVLRCHDFPSSSWSTTHTFSGVSGQASWSDSLSNDWRKAFYRIESE